MFYFIHHSFIFLFFFLSYGAHRDLHSFPTRRSSDLKAAMAQRRRRGRVRSSAVIHASPEVGRSMDKDRKSTRLNSSHVAISYAVFCLKKKKKKQERKSERNIQMQQTTVIWKKQHIA